MYTTFTTLTPLTPDTTHSLATRPRDDRGPRRAVSLSASSAFLCALLVGACSFDAAGARGGDDDPAGDAGASDDDDANPPGGPQPHLLLSEVNPKPVAREFIEIFNPGALPVDLTNYYLSDDPDYALLPGLTGDGPTPSLGVTDFLVQFPEGASIAAGQVIVVALGFDDFAQEFSFAPDYAILQARSPASEMRPIFVDTSSSITDNGEYVVLLFWDGASDLVRDVDIVPAGNDIEPVNQLADKSSIAVDGPDGDQDPTSYAPDAFTIGEMAEDAGLDQSYKRIAREDGHEAQTGEGNGLTGDDETSEDVAETWNGPEAFSSPTPGQIPASLANP